MKIQHYFPKTIRSIVKKILALPSVCYNSLFWLIRTSKNNILDNDKETMLARFLIADHILEKGLTMPNRRLGFGKENVCHLVDGISEFISKYGADYMEIQAVLNDLNEYVQIHEHAHYTLSQDILSGINQLLVFRKDNSGFYNLSFTEDDFFSDANFHDFAYSRHTCRHFNGQPVDLGSIQKSIEVALSAPSACNRQSTKVIVIQRKEIMDFVLGIQNGNRGFGNHADKLLMIYSDFRFWDPSFFKSAYLDAGIFTMNLLYALHEQKIAACTLNAHLKPSQINKIQDKLQMKKTEIPIVFIAIGHVPQQFLVARSPRRNVHEMYRVV